MWLVLGFEVLLWTSVLIKNARGSVAYNGILGLVCALKYTVQSL